jgi:hypothetical protein
MRIPVLLITRITHVGIQAIDHEWQAVFSGRKQVDSGAWHPVLHNTEICVASNKQ